MDLQKISKSWNLAYLWVLWAQKQCSKFQNFGVSIKKIIEIQKWTQAAWPPLVLLIFNLQCQLWGVITFEWVVSLCRNFQDISHIYLSSGKVSSKSEMGHVPTFKILVQLSWNDPFKYKMQRFLQFWGELNTCRIVKICPFHFLHDYYHHSLDVMFPQFPNHFLLFPMVFPHVSPSVSTTFLVFLLLFPLVFPLSCFRFCEFQLSILFKRVKQMFV